MSQVSSSVGTQRGSDSELSKDKLKIQNIVETLCPRLCQAKAILQDYMPVGSHTGSLLQKMTQALAEQAVEVTSNISHLLEGAEEKSQHLDDILQLEQTLRDIYVFVQSETQRNLLLRVLFAKDLRVRYFSLDSQLKGLLKLFEQTVKKPLVLCATIQPQAEGDHPVTASDDDVALAEENLSPNNTSAVHASCSFFNHAINPVVHGGTFYNAQKLVVKQVHSCDRTPQGIVEGAEVFTFGDVLAKKEIYKGRGYRVYSGTAKAKAVKIKLYEGSRAKDRCLAGASFSQKVMHPNVLHLIGVSSLNSELPFLVFDESSEWAIESIIAAALGKGLKESLFLGLQTVAGLSSGLDYLRTLLFPFASVGLDHFVVTSSHDGNILISFDPEVLLDEAHEQDHSGASNGGNELDIFHGLCQKTFDAACKAHYEFQKVQRSDHDELNVNNDLDQDPTRSRFMEIEDDAETPLVDTEGPISEVSTSAPSAASSMPSISPPKQLRKSSPSVRRRELVWKSQKNETLSLEEIARQFQSFLLKSSTELEFDRRRGRYTRKTAHRCPGYNRIEITLTSDIARSAIISHLTPTPHEICPVCKEIVKDAEIFACICGRDDDESIPTIKCSTCSEWHHRPCVSISENEDQSFVCRRCKVPVVTAANIVHSIYKALSDSIGASDDYQCLIVELRSFEQALRLLHCAIAVTPPTGRDALDIAAETTTCLELLKRFHDRIGLYQKALEGRKDASWRKTGWSLFKDDEIASFRQKISQHKQNMALFLNELTFTGVAHYADEARRGSASTKEGLSALEKRLPETIRYGDGNLTLINTFGNPMTIPLELCVFPEKLHDTLMTYYKGKLDEDQVKNHKYIISTEDGKSLAQASNWHFVVRKDAVLVMSMVVDQAQRNTCPQCYETDLGVMGDGEGWLRCRRCERKFRTTVISSEQRLGGEVQ